MKINCFRKRSRLVFMARRWRQKTTRAYHYSIYLGTDKLDDKVGHALWTHGETRHTRLNRPKNVLQFFPIFPSSPGLCVPKWEKKTKNGRTVLIWNARSSESYIVGIWGSSEGWYRVYVRFERDDVYQLTWLYINRLHAALGDALHLYFFWRWTE